MPPRQPPGFLRSHDHCAIARAGMYFTAIFLFESVHLFVGEDSPGCVSYG